MMIGYARVSALHQDLDIQMEALTKAGCERIYQEKLTAKDTDRPEFQKMMASIKEGDTIVATYLDRLCRNMMNALEFSDEVDSKNANFFIVQQPFFDTRTPAGKLIFQFMAGIAEFERSLILERTSRGRAKAVQNGVKMGRKPGCILPKTIERANIIQSMMQSGYSQYKIAKHLKISPGAVCRIVKKMPSLFKAS